MIEELKAAIKAVRPKIELTEHLTPLGEAAIVVCDAAERSIRLEEALSIAQKALKNCYDACLCERRTEGFDYGDVHPTLGKCGPAKRWAMPDEIIREAERDIKKALTDTGEKS